MADEVTRKEVDELKQNFAEVLEIAKKRKDKEEKTGNDLAEYKSEQEAAAKSFMSKFDEMDKKQADAIAEVKKRNEELEKAIANMEQGGAQDEKGFTKKQLDVFNHNLKAFNPGAPTIEMKDAGLVKSAYDKILCCKAGLLTPEEKTTINSIIDPQGGYITAPQYDQTLINKKFDLRGVLDLIDIKNVATGEYKQAVDDADYDSASYLNELANADPTEHAPDYKLVTWNLTEQIFKTTITRIELEDAFIQGGVEVDVLGKARQGIIRKTAAQVVLGNGVDKPKGLLTYASGTTQSTIEQITSYASTSISWEDVISLLPKALSDAYHDNAAYAMNRTSFFELLVDKDSGGQLKLMNQINFFNRNGVSMTIMGAPVKFDAAISNAATAGNFAVIYGDFKEAYSLTERNGFSVIVDDVTSAQVVTYRIRRRNDGRLKMGRALKILKIKA